MPRAAKWIVRAWLAAALTSFALCQAPAAPTVLIDANAPRHPFPHYWEQMFGSGRAILSLRDSYRRDLREVKDATDFQYVRFHAIFHDEVGIYDEDAQGHSLYNFSYVDQIYDGLLANHVRPFIELSFMPRKLAAKDAPQAFWYKPNVAPPKDWAKWDDLITQFARHLVERYGADEVSHWYFEVWNEPNLDFWAGVPAQATYFELYDHTARALKAVNNKLRVGGPATAQAAWIPDFIKHCVENKIPVDFVSTHAYGDDTAKDILGTNEQIPREQMLWRAVKKVHEQILASPKTDVALIWSEFNASWGNHPEVTDASYMAAWLAHTIRLCDGMTEMMSYWTFDDVFEEQGVVKTPFYGGFGLIAAGDIPKPAFAAFKVLHKLGSERISADSETTLVTRTAAGQLVLAVWNISPPDNPGSPRTITLDFKNTKPTTAVISRVDHDHGDPSAAYQKMGKPRYPTPQQIQTLRQAAALPAAEIHKLANGKLTLTMAPHSLAVIEMK
jgi:xylan 1,4-beta-xylosidase